jgi:hypothetical protein
MNKILDYFDAFGIIVSYPYVDPIDRQMAR